ncbi:MAG: TMEM165/GDT1 family protein [Proteobacteria bacterium]|nr:TMEM165/GDT1 family protein [Pseudomonadota bacterium]
MTKLLIIFITIFLAELGDKTQIATLLYASDKGNNPFWVFVFASLALVASSAVAVLLGSYGAKYLEAIPLKLIAGIAFMIIGAWTIFEHFKS